MSIAVYRRGTVKRITGTFRDIADALADPTTVTLKVVAPDSVTLIDTETSYTYAGGTVSKLSTGVYYKDLTLAVDGHHYIRWESTGTPTVANEEPEFLVASERF
jgi:hypothetical protein